MSFDPSLAPRVRTELPGPRSRELWARDAALHGVQLLARRPSGCSWCSRTAAAQWCATSTATCSSTSRSGAVVANLGHAPPAVADAARPPRRAGSCTSSTSPRRPGPSSSRRWPGRCRPALQTFQMYSTGAEAVEAALRLAKSFTGNYEVISFHQAWHGRTLGAMSLMGGFPLKQGYGPFAPGVAPRPEPQLLPLPARPDPRPLRGGVRPAGRPGVRSSRASSGWPR